MVFSRSLIDCAPRTTARRKFSQRVVHLQVAMDANKCLLVSMSFVIVPLSPEHPEDILLFSTLDLDFPAHIDSFQHATSIVYSSFVYHRDHNIHPFYKTCFPPVPVLSINVCHESLQIHESRMSLRPPSRVNTPFWNHLTLGLDHGPKSIYYSMVLSSHDFLGFSSSPLSACKYWLLLDPWMSPSASLIRSQLQERFHLFLLYFAYGFVFPWFPRFLKFTTVCLQVLTEGVRTASLLPTWSNAAIFPIQPLPKTMIHQIIYWGRPNLQHKCTNCLSGVVIIYRRRGGVVEKGGGIEF